MWKDMTLRKCLSCLHLRANSFVIGYFTIVLSITVLVTQIIRHITEEPGTPVPQDASVERPLGTTVLLVFLLYLLTSIGLVVGLHKHKPFLVRVYYTFMFVMLISGLISFIYSLTVWRTKRSANLLIYSLVNGYFVAITRSAYYEMLEQQNESDSSNIVNNMIIGEPTIAPASVII